MASRIRIQLWDEAVELSEGFNRLQQAGLEESALQTLTEQLIIERTLRDFQLLEGMKPKQLLAQHKASLSEKQRKKLDDQLKASPELQEQLISRLCKEHRLTELKRQLIPSPMIQDAFLNFKAQRESVIFQLLRLPSEKMIRELYFRITHDRIDFDSLIRQYADPKEAEEGGLAGPIPIGKLKPELKQQVLMLKPGETSAPFCLEGNQWLLLRVLRRDNILMTPEIETQIRDNLFATWLQQQLASAQALPAALNQSRVSRMNPELCQR